MDDPARYTDRKTPSADGIKNGFYDKWRVFTLSAKDQSTTLAMIKNLQDYLRSMEQPYDEDEFLENMAFTLDSRRTFFPWLAAVPAQNLSGLIEGLGGLKPAQALKTPRLGFVFNGQGAQWFAMGRELISAYPIFKESLEQGDAYLKDLGAPFSLMGAYWTCFLSVANTDAMQRNSCGIRKLAGSMRHY